MAEAVEISAEDLDFFVNFLENEGLSDFDFSVKEDEEELVSSFYAAQYFILHVMYHQPQRLGDLLDRNFIKFWRCHFEF